MSSAQSELNKNDEMPISMNVLQEIYEISNSLSSIMMLLEQSHNDEYIEARSIFLPSVKRLECIVSEQFPDFSRIVV
jgi:hypothetical protein